MDLIHLPKLKKIIIIKKTDHNQQCPFQNTKQTITEDFSFSHFYANFCTGRKLIQKGYVGKKMRCFSRPDFRIQRANYVVISISNSSFTSPLEQQRSDKVCVFKARLSAFEVSQLSSEFFVQIRDVQVDESQYETLLVIIKEVLFLLLLCVKSLLCEDLFMSNVHFPWPYKLTILSW